MAKNGKAPQLARDIEILKWEYLCAGNAMERMSSIVKIAAAEARMQLMSDFNSASKGQGGAPFSLGLSGMWAIRNGLSDWEKAKKQNDFSVASRSLQKLVDKTKEKARRYAEANGLSSPYEALLDAQTPGLRLHHLDQWSEELAPFCKNLWQKLVAGQNSVRVQLDLSVPEQKQQKMTRNLLDHIGYDFMKGKVANAPHPVCLGTYDDVRIGMSYDKGDISKTFLSAMHEGGHAWYRQHLPIGQKNGPWAGIAGSGIDETMALIFENHIGRGRGGAILLQGMAQLVANDHDGVLDARELYRHMIAIDPDAARKDADEVRYPLDVILRYRLEKALFDEGYPVRELPALWRKEYKDLTGIEVKDDSDGILQDVHWFGGAFGWFPNYLFGTLAAAQLFEKACMDKPQIREDLGAGNSDSLNSWLYENIARHGTGMEPMEMVKKATGRPLETGSYKSHVWRRYVGEPSVAKPPCPSPKQ